MDVFDLGESRRFLAARPLRVGVFDRPRVVCELLCLEQGQQEVRGNYPASDQLYVVLDGQARIRAGPQIEELHGLQAVLVPPGVEHVINNTGEGRLTVLALVTPKPSRSGEVPMPVSARPAGGRGRPPRQAATREEALPLGPRRAAPAVEAPFQAAEAATVARRPRTAPRPPGGRGRPDGAGAGREPAAPARSRFATRPPRGPVAGAGRERPASGPPRQGSRTAGPRGRGGPGGGQAPPRERPAGPRGRTRPAGEPQPRGRGGRAPAPGPNRPAAGQRGRPGSGRSGPRTSGRR